MTRGRVSALVAMAICALAQRGDTADRRVEILKAPHFVTDDSTIGFYLRILPDETNRRFEVAAVDATANYAVRVSGEDLPGPTTRLIEWEPIPAGEYEIIASLYGADDTVLARASSHVEVLEWRGP